MTTDLRIKDFKRIVFFTGAGLSAESGIPTYRGQGGLWHEYDWETYACQKAFDRDPAAVWKFHNMRRAAVAACAPNQAHLAIARCEALLPDVTVVTQNIDGFHPLVGSRNLFELHGSLWRVRCDTCGAIKDNRDLPFEDLRCGKGWWRPDIVWFGDHLREDVIEGASKAISACDLLVSIGTSGVVYPAAQLPRLAQRAGAVTIEINPEPTPMSDAYEVCLRMGASEAMALLCQGLDV